MNRLLMSSASTCALLACASVSAQTTTAAAGAATASQNESSADNEVVVTGIRRSLENAAQIKRDSPAIVDAISAEDIGKFPDQNVADSLQRVTGVQVTRSQGEANKVSVRGLSPDFTQTMFNGGVLTSNGSRSADFNLISSDFVRAVEVYKTPTADMIDGGLSATIDIRIAKPFEVGKDRYALAADGIWEPNAGKVGPHFTGYLNKMLADDRAGVYFGADLQERKYRTFESLGFGTLPTTEAADNFDYNQDGDKNDTFRLDLAHGTQVTQGDRRRLTLLGGTQWDITDTVRLSADMLFTKFKDGNIEPWNVPLFTSRTGPVLDAHVSGRTIDYFEAAGVQDISTTRTVISDSTTVAPSAELEWKKDGFTVDGKATLSRTRTYTSSLGVETDSNQTVAYDFRPDPGGIPSIIFANPAAQLDPNQQYALGLNGQYRAPTTDKNWDARLDAGRDFDGSFLKKIAIGGYYADRKFSYVSQSVVLNAQQLADISGLTYSPTIGGGSVNAAPLMVVGNYPNAFSQYSGGGRPSAQFLYGDLNKLFSLVPLSKILAQYPPFPATSSDFAIEEKSKAGYIRVDFAAIDDRLAGNVGVRYVNTETLSNGGIPDFSTIVISKQGSVTTVKAAPATATSSYGKWLPSLNMRYRLTDELQLRLAAAKVLTRPDLNRLTPAVTIDANVGTIKSGNPNLQPYQATQLDTSLEYYFGQGGLLSLGGFYKDLTTFIIDGTTRQSYNVTQKESGVVSAMDFTRSLPVNASGSKLKGIELGAQVPLTFLPGALDGFGIGANATFLDVGELELSQGSGKQPLPGVSKRTFNGIAYYEKYGFGARISYTYRSRYTNSQFGVFGDGNYSRSFGLLDGSVSYDVSNRLVLTADIANILNSPVQQYNIDGYSILYEDDGRRITFGARYRF